MSCSGEIYLVVTKDAKPDRLLHQRRLSKHFGLVSVDLNTLARTVKPGALHLGAVARANRI